MYFLSSLYGTLWLTLFHNFELRIAVIIIVVLLIINFFLRLFIRQYVKKTSNSKYGIDELCVTVNRPVKYLSITVGAWVFVALNELHFSTMHFDVTMINRVFKAAVIILSTWLIISVINLFRNRLIKKRSSKNEGYGDNSIIYTIFKCIEIAVYLIVLITLLAIFNIPVSGLIAVGGIGGAALAFANQSLIANMFSGMAIYFDRPFSIGDWIYTNDGKIEGTVEKIGLRLTKIRCFDKRPMFVPNSIFNMTPTVNASRMTNRRIQQFIGLRYQDIDHVKEIMSSIRDVLKNLEGIDQNQSQIVNLVNGTTDMGSTIEGCFGSSSINIQISAYTKATNIVSFYQIQDELMLTVFKIVTSCGAQFAFPSRSVYTETLTESANPASV